jgi:nicotinamidase-related amidase
MKTPALVIIDLQKEFIDPRLPGKIGSSEKGYCKLGIIKLLQIARKWDWRVIHVGTQHKDTASMSKHLQRRNTPIFCQPNSEGSKFEVDVQKEEFVLYKTHYNAFSGTELGNYLAGYDEVVFAGIAADCCVLTSVFEADARGFRSYVPFQCVSASKIDSFVVALGTMSKSAADVIDMEKIEWPQKSLGEAVVAHDEVREKARLWFANQKN